MKTNEGFNLTADEMQRQTALLIENFNKKIAEYENNAAEFENQKQMVAT